MSLSAVLSQNVAFCAVSFARMNAEIQYIVVTQWAVLVAGLIEMHQSS